MTHLLLTVLHSQALHHALIGALSGWATAAHVDYLAFTMWKSFEDAREYHWVIALWRWVQGAVIGAVLTTGFGGILG